MRLYNHLSLALPAMDECGNIDALLQLLRSQTCQAFTLYVCVNQPEEWWSLPCSDWRRKVCDDNQATMRLLSDVSDMQVIVLDHCSRGCGVTAKQQGVGWARKFIMQSIESRCDDNEVVVSLDADASFSPHYLEEILALFNCHTSVMAAAMPYFHPVVADESTCRAMLRYECYMRHYVLNMMRIGNPYAFTALGSAMAFPLWAYKRVGGYTPLQGGEDFYLLQKMAKCGKLLNPTETALLVEPQGRQSHRVPFGTGPAVAIGAEHGGIAQLDERYPFFSTEAFDEVKQTYDLFPSLYIGDVETPMSPFLRRQLRTDMLWQPLRKNFHQQHLFVHACMERVDGLRILQYIRSCKYPHHQLWIDRDWQQVMSAPIASTPQGYVMVDFATDLIDKLNQVRKILFKKEMVFRSRL